VQTSGANVLYGLYSGSHAAEFVQAYSASGISAGLAVGSLAVEDFQLGTVGSSAIDVISAASWTATRSTNTNKAFTKAFKTRYGRIADPYAALGFDTALLVAEGAVRAVRNGMGLRRLIEALAGATIASPRGTLNVDAATNTVIGPLFVRTVKRLSGSLGNYDIAEVAAVTAFPEPLSPLASGPVSGYFNEYLCT
jgi:ABC-type branched-subunit amino acid transport system substrate-binding protein